MSDKAKPLTGAEIYQKEARISRIQTADPAGFGPEWYPLIWGDARWLATLAERDKRVKHLEEANALQAQGAARMVTRIAELEGALKDMGNLTGSRIYSKRA